MSWQVLRWRIDLARTEPHWPGWFKGLSQRFLAAPGARLLLLAGVDRYAGFSLVNTDYNCLSLVNTNNTNVSLSTTGWTRNSLWGRCRASSRCRCCPRWVTPCTKTVRTGSPKSSPASSSGTSSVSL